MVGRILQPEAFVPDHHFGVVPETDLDHRGSLEINIGGNVRRPAVFFHLELCREDVLVQVLFYHIATAVEDPKVFPEVFLQKFLRLFLEGIRIEIAINLLLRRGGRRVKGGGTRRRQSSYRRTGAGVVGSCVGTGTGMGTETGVGIAIGAVVAILSHIDP